MDDENIILDVSRDPIEKLGYEVLTVKSEIEAIEIYSASQGTVDIVILDIAVTKNAVGFTIRS